MCLGLLLRGVRRLTSRHCWDCALPRAAVPCCGNALGQACSGLSVLCLFSLLNHFVWSKTQSWLLCVSVPELLELLWAAGEWCDYLECLVPATACQCAYKDTALRPPKSIFFGICPFPSCVRECALSGDMLGLHLSNGRVTGPLPPELALGLGWVCQVVFSPVAPHALLQFFPQKQSAELVVFYYMLQTNQQKTQFLGVLLV